MKHLLAIACIALVSYLAIDALVGWDGLRDNGVFGAVTIAKVSLIALAAVFIALSRVGKSGLESWRAKKRAEARFEYFALVCLLGFVVGIALHMALR